MKASALSKTREVRLDFGEDGDLNVVIDPSVLTPALQMSVQVAGEDDAQVFCDLFPRLVKKWDLVDDKEKVIPLTPESVATLPYVLLARVFSEVSEALGEEISEEGKA